MNSYHVAHKAGVSRAVVSYVYHGKADQHRIPKQTQERVRAAIRETGYTTSSGTCSCSGGR
jgi:DNA-binding LacI/PurR family transcriptional regulator